MDYKEKLKSKTRWDYILDSKTNYRLLCSDPLCSLSCANLKNGKLLVTSMHGTARHSYQFTKTDMAFASIMFLDSLSEEDLKVFTQMFNKISLRFLLESKSI